ncbi:MAG: signal peptidase II [Eubacteriales bacterium]|nr:signal peptidase II [Eubacteriales bacterium]
MKSEKNLSAAFCAVTGAASIVILTLLDQYTKILALSGLKGQDSVVLIKGVLELKYLENRGIAFGMFQGKIPFFVILCIIFFGTVVYAFIRIPKKRYYLPLMLIGYILTAGALGNFIDRVFRGFVVDFIYFSLIDFPIFNLADIYVVVSGVLLVLFVCFKYKEEEFVFFNPKHKG